MFPLILLPFIPLILVPLGLAIALTFRRAHGCDACTVEYHTCERLRAGKICPFFD